MTASKSLPARPSLESLRKQAKRLARDIAAGDAGASARARMQLPDVDLPLTQRNAQLENLIASSDIVSLHLPLTPETQGILDPRKMKAGAILVNTARGGLVNEEFLLEALKSGHLAAAGLDVFAAEPPRGDHPLLLLPNVVCAPHLAWLTQETIERSLSIALDNVRRLESVTKLLHRVA